MSFCRPHYRTECQECARIKHSLVLQALATESYKTIQDASVNHATYQLTVCGITFDWEDVQNEFLRSLPKTIADAESRKIENGETAENSHT